MFLLEGFGSEYTYLLAGFLPRDMCIFCMVLDLSHTPFREILDWGHAAFWSFRLGSGYHFCRDLDWSHVRSKYLQGYGLGTHTVFAGLCIGIQFPFCTILDIVDKVLHWDQVTFLQGFGLR